MYVVLLLSHLFRLESRERKTTLKMDLSFFSGHQYFQKNVSTRDTLQEAVFFRIVFRIDHLFPQ